MMAEEEEEDEKDAKEQKTMDNETIHTKSPGAHLCVSFHVKAWDQILCYLYVNGQYLRFMPEDLISILPRFFVQSEANIEFIEEEKHGAKELVAEMEKVLRDEQFA